MFGKNIVDNLNSLQKGLKELSNINLVDNPISEIDEYRE